MSEEGAAGPPAAPDGSAVSTARRRNITAGRWRRIGHVARRLPPHRGTALVLVLAIALTGGAAMAAMVGARRAQHALPDFIAWAHPEDAGLFADPALPPAQQETTLRQASRLPGVAAAQRIAVVLVSVHRGSGAGRIPLIGYVGIDPPFVRLRRARVLRGRLPRASRADELAINEDLSHRLHLGVGDEIKADLFRPDQLEILGNGQTPSHPEKVVSFRIVGLVRTPSDLESDPEAERGTLYEFNNSLLYPTPAFWRAWGHRIAGYGIGVRVELAGTNVRALSTNIRKAGLRVQLQTGSDIVRDRPSLERSTHVESGALWTISGLIALVSVVLIGPALRRTVAVSVADRVALRALGLTRGNLVAVEARRSAPIVLAGAVLSVPVAVAVSPWAAFGVSRQALLHPGVTFSPVFLLAGASTMFVAALVMTVLAAALSRPRHPADAGIGSVGSGGRRLLARLAGAGAPPSLLAGARMALPSNGRHGSAIRSAVLTVAAGIALLVAALTFGASMTHLVRTPSLRGWTWDVEAGNFSEVASAKHAGQSLARDHDVADFTGTNTVAAGSPAGTLNLLGLAEVGMAQLPALSGRLPSNSGEIAVTARTLAKLHRHVGDRVTLRANDAVTFRIVGTTLGPGAVAPDTQLADGGLVTLPDLARLLPGANAIEGYLVRFRPGVDRTSALAGLRPTFHNTVLGPFATTEVRTIERTEPLALLFAALVAILALGALVHAVATALRRYRREVALLKALGFGRRQVRSTILSQAALLVGVAGLIGLPVGLIAGRWAWRLAASTIGVIVEPVVPLASVSAVVVAAFGAALAVGAVAARSAERVPAAAALRTE